jgi:hypothetical protein
LEVWVVCTTAPQKRAAHLPGPHFDRGQ